MKRYDIHFNYGDPVMVERPTGEYYSRADLIASGCLVPVPDGEACSISDISMFSLFTCDHDGVWLKFGLDSWHYYARNIMTGEETPLLDSAIVQPVRLVPLEDVG